MKPIRETLNADLPQRWIISLLRRLPARSGGSTAEIDETTVAYHFHEPLGWSDRLSVELPLLMAAWKLAPALAAGTAWCSPAEQTPLSITLLLELIGDLFPAGVLNVVQGFGKEAGEALATSKRIAAGVYRLHAGRAAYSRLRGGKYYPCTVELGKSPNIYFADVMDGEEEFIEKAVEGWCSASSTGEVCTCPSRALIHESIYEPFMARVRRSRSDPDRRSGFPPAVRQDPLLYSDCPGRGWANSDRRRAGGYRAGAG